MTLDVSVGMNFTRSFFQNRSVNLRSFVTQAQNMTKYRSSVCRELGKPLSVESRERKSLENGQVRVSVGATGINFADILMCAGKYQEKAKTPFVPGSEIAGVISEIGPGATDLKVGDRVIAMSPTRGGFSEEVVVNTMATFKLEKNMPFNKSASLVCSYGTAWLGLHYKAKIQKGETVLVTAAAGAVGLASVDMATNVYGAKVIGACGGEAKCDLVKSKGAIAAIDYTKENIRDRVLELTDGRGVDVVVDIVGGSTFMDCLRSLAFEGRLIVVGFVGAPEIPQIPANRLLLKSCSAMGIFWGSYAHRNPVVFVESIRSVLDLFQRRIIDPHVSAEFPLTQVNEAFDFINSRKSTGKVVITPQSHGKL